MAKGQSIGGVTIIVGANSSPMLKEFARAKSGLSSFVSSVGGFGKMAGAVAVGTMVAGAVDKVMGAVTGMGSGMIAAGADSVRMAAQMEQSRAAFDVLTGSAEKGKAAIEGLQKLAVDTPFSSKEMIGYGKSLLGMGASAEQLVPILGRLGDVAMGDSETLGRLVLQFGQVMNSGSFKKEEFNVFAEAGADVQAFAKAAGTSMQGLNAMFERGEVSARVMVDGFNMMTSAGGRFYGMNATMSQTTLGQFNSFTEKMDLMKTSLGKSFLDGFRPGDLLGKIADGMGGIDKITGRLTAFFGNVRNVFDRAAAAAGAFASVLIDRVGAGLGMLDNSQGWRTLEEVADNVMRSILMGVGGVIDKLGEFRQTFADTLRTAAEVAKALAPKTAAQRANEMDAHYNDPNLGMGALLWYGAGSTIDAGMSDWMGGDKTAAQMQSAADSMKKLADSIGNAMQGQGRAVGPDLIKDYNTKMAALRRSGQPGGPGAGVDLIQNAPPGMSKKATEYLSSAVKPSNKYAEFMRDAALANEVSKYGKASDSEAALNKLAGGFLDLQRDFVGSMEVKLPAAMLAGSQEANSIITRAVQTPQQSAQERVASILEMVRKSSERQEDELKKIREELKNPKYNVVSIN